MEDGDVGFYGADISNNITNTDRVRIKYKRLNHSPFVYKFSVTNTGASSVDSIVRVFLADEKVTHKLNSINVCALAHIKLMTREHLQLLKWTSFTGDLNGEPQNLKDLQMTHLQCQEKL